MPAPRVRSLLEAIPADLPEERFDNWLSAPGFRLERILSRGHVTPEGQWYDQIQDEWVAVLQGAATLMIEGQVEPIEMRPGDSVLLPAHCRHRVSWTDPDQVTIWLALHFPSAEN
jgi:cupin 2 domain-containing protein